MKKKNAEELLYTKEHEWVYLDGGEGIVGISDFAQGELGELVFIELPSIGKMVARGETLCVVESTKAASDVYAPISGKVKRVNTELASSPQLVNSDPFGTGWLVVLEECGDTEGLLDFDQYSELIGYGEVRS